MLEDFFPGAFSGRLAGGMSHHRGLQPVVSRIEQGEPRPTFHLFGHVDFLPEALERQTGICASVVGRSVFPGSFPRSGPPRPVAVPVAPHVPYDLVHLGAAGAQLAGVRLDRFLAHQPRSAGEVGAPDVLR